MSRVGGAHMYWAGPLSPWGSVINAVVSGILVVVGIVNITTNFEPFFLAFLAIALLLNVFFVMMAIRVHTGRTLYDRQLLADLEEEERERAD